MKKTIVVGLAAVLGFAAFSFQAQAEEPAKAPVRAPLSLEQRAKDAMSALISGTNQIAAKVEKAAAEAGMSGLGFAKHTKEMFAAIFAGMKKHGLAPGKGALDFFWGRIQAHHAAFSKAWNAIGGAGTGFASEIRGSYQLIHELAKDLMSGTLVRAPKQITEAIKGFKTHLVNLAKGIPGLKEKVAKGVAALAKAHEDSVKATHAAPAPKK